MFSNLSISKKLILLVAVPLLLELGFIAVLGGLLNQVERERAAESHARELSGALNTFLRRSLDMTASTVLHYVSRDAAFRVHIEEEKQKLKNLMRNIVDLASTNPREKAAVERLDQLSKEAEDHLTSARDYLNHQDRLMAMREWIKMRDKSKELAEQIDKIVEEQAEIQQDKKAREKLYREQLEGALYAGVALNVLVAFALLATFNNNLSKRLNILTDNIFRLASNKDLNPALAGRDEIAQLDGFFRQMAMDLRDAKEKERAIVAMVSHDLKSPLTSVRMFHSSLSDGFYGELSENGRKRLVLVESEIERLIELINDLLDVERIEAGEFVLDKVSVDLSDTLKRAVDTMSTLAESKQISLTSETSGNTKTLADDDRLFQVLINLLGNAVKFSPKGSAIDLRADQNGRWIRITVADRGRAIPENMRETIFDRFKQVEAADRRERAGSGLGLAICRAIVEAHSGKIGVTPREGGGNTFWFDLPAVANPPSSSS